jgi:hypothetical protein
VLLNGVKRMLLMMRKTKSLSREGVGAAVVDRRTVAFGLHPSRFSSGLRASLQTAASGPAID